KSTENLTSISFILALVDFCRGDPCGKNLATCISLNSNYTCECKYGFYYSNENCYRGKVFPATIAVNANYTDRLQDVNSAEYEDMFNNLSKFFKEALGNLGYVRTVIVKIQLSKDATEWVVVTVALGMDWWSRPPSKSRNSAPLNVTVTNLFMLNSTADAATVDFAVKYAIENGSQFNVDSYLVAKQCDIYQCDTKTTVCEEGTEFPECKCKPDLEKTQWDDLSCSACSNTCSAKANKYCVKEQDVPICKCMANFKNESGNCVAGKARRPKVSTNIELILIIVGTVLGAIVLSLVIAVSIISVRAKDKQNPEKRSLIKSGYSGTNTSDDRPSMFPRVQTTSGHANPGYQPNNPYEMHSNNRDNFPERDYDDLVSVSHSPVGMEYLNSSTVGYRHCWNLSSPLYILPWFRRPK
ncbi:hypothetical protein Nmel_009580, partial [Mimus melanotis]